MRAVCSLWAIALVLGKLFLKVDTLQKIDNDGIFGELQTNNNSVELNPFVEVNVYVISAETEAWQDGYSEDITQSRMTLTVQILLDRFGCSSEAIEDTNEACSQVSTVVNM